MITLRADFHIHTLLSPCGDLGMSPRNILAMARAKHLDVIGITDHNSTKQALLIQEMGKEAGIFVMCGAEITTKEEIHCLAFMPDPQRLALLQEYINDYLPNFPNDTNRFGYQVAVDRDENIVYEAPYLLINGLDQSLEEVSAFVRKTGGLFIPAHVNRAKFSIISQLGFVPPDLDADALEISRHITPEELFRQFSYLSKWNILRDSDAHLPEDIGRVYNLLEVKGVHFDEIVLAIRCQEGRKTQVAG